MKGVRDEQTSEETSEEVKKRGSREIEDGGKQMRCWEGEPGDSERGREGGREEHREEAAVRSVHSDRTQQQQQQRDNGPQRVLTGTLSPTNPQVGLPSVCLDSALSFSHFVSEEEGSDAEQQTDGPQRGLPSVLVPPGPKPDSDTLEHPHGQKPSMFLWSTVAFSWREKNNTTFSV